jgi:hypothetical protein
MNTNKIEIIHLTMLDPSETKVSEYHSHAKKHKKTCPN